MQIIKDQEMETDHEEEEPKNFLDIKGCCKYCKHRFPKSEKPLKNKVFKDESGKRFIIDSKGNKVYVLTDEKGQIYYLDENGNIVIV